MHITEQLKKAIKEDYNLKANILGPTACSMAMQLDLRDQLNKSKGQVHPAQLAMGATPALQTDTKDDVGLKFNLVLMYGGQGEHEKCLPANIFTAHDLQCHTGDAARDAATPSMLSVKGRLGQSSPKQCRQLVSGLDQPRLRATGVVIMGRNKKKLRAVNWRQRQAMQRSQATPTLWTHYTKR